MNLKRNLAISILSLEALVAVACGSDAITPNIIAEREVAPTAVEAAPLDLTYEVIISNEDMGSILFSTEMELYEQGKHPVAAGIKAVLEELGMTSDLKESVTFTSEETIEGLVGGTIKDSRIIIKYPSHNIDGLHVSMQEDGNLPVLAITYHEFTHLIQGNNNDPEAFNNLDRFFNFFKDRNLKFKGFINNTGTLALAIGPSDAVGDRGSKTYGMPQIYFDNVFSEENAEGILREFGMEFGFKDYRLSEIKQGLLDAYKRTKAHQDEGSPILEAVAYITDTSTRFDTLDELVESGVQKSVRAIESDVPLDRIYYATELVGQLYGLLEKQGYAGIALDLEVAKITGQLFTPTENQSPFERFEAHLEKLRGEEELPDGREVLEGIMDRKRIQVNRQMDSVKGVWAKLLRNQYAPNPKGSYNIEATSMGGTYLVKFTELK